jgi:hypothetical protein
MVCPNAAFFSKKAVFCAGLTGVDTMAHEWGHAYVVGCTSLVLPIPEKFSNEFMNRCCGREH